MISQAWLVSKLLGDLMVPMVALARKEALVILMLVIVRVKMELEMVVMQSAVMAVLVA